MRHLTPFKLPRISRQHAVLILVVCCLLVAAAPMYAQTNTPVPPTSTPVPTLGITIPMGTVMNSTNNWIEVFAPVAAIGIGISIAIAVLAYLGKIIRSAFN